MNDLTDKQKANRAYYRKHAETIRAQKRAAYEAKTGTRKKKTAVRISVERSAPAVKRTAVSADDLARMNARRRIEDFKLAQELGIEGF